MKLLKIIPIMKVSPKEELFYFTNKKVNIGDLVTVPLKNKNVTGIIFDIADINKTKSSLKSLDFKLKPIKNVLAASIINKNFLSACEEIAKYFVSSTGEVLKDFIPASILKKPPNIFLDQTEKIFRYEKIFAPHTTQERIQYYKSIIREEFAKGNSIFLCLPSILSIYLKDGNYFLSEIQRGIENYTFILHSKLSLKKTKELWEKILNEKHSVLIIATKTFLSVPRGDISTIILEEESSTLYKTEKRPYLDIRKAVEIICQKTKKRLVIGDLLIRTETVFKETDKENFLLFPRPLSGAEQIIINMKEEKTEKEWQRKKDFLIFSSRLKEIIEEAYKKNEKILLFINRKGYNPITICQDCRSIITCENCDSPLVLHKPENYWVCHKCFLNIKSPDRCPYCKSWRLETLGIGIERVLEEAEKFFPKEKIFRMDGETIRSFNQGVEIIKKINTSPEAMLVGTEIIFSYLDNLKEYLFERVAVVSLDSLFAIPDFRINEKIFRMLLKLRGLAKKTFLIQSRFANSFPLFEKVIRGNISGFYKEEIENRKVFGYPPFTLPIKISLKGKDNLKTKREIEKLKAELGKYNPVVYPAFISKIKNNFLWHLLIKIEPDHWPEKEKELYQKLFSLTPNWKIDINPENLL